MSELVQGDTEEFGKPPVDSDLGCSVILPGQQVATIAAHQLPGVSELQGGPQTGEILTYGLPRPYVDQS